jgi:4-carboxymuconolactone decarboxylase
MAGTGGRAGRGAGGGKLAADKKKATADANFKRGIRLRRQMFGRAGAEDQIEAATDFNLPLQDFVSRICFGEIWQRPHLDKKTRSMITLAMLVATGRNHEIKVHTRGAIANGVSKDELRELILHSVLYCGLPMAVDGYRAATEVLKELGLE